LESYSQSVGATTRREEDAPAESDAAVSSAAVEPDVRSGSGAADTRAVSGEIHSSAELMERFQGKAADAPMCMTCGTKMRPAGSCYVCEGCGSTSGCS
jgi:hypothetical protein